MMLLKFYSSIFWELIRTPFQHSELIWGIVPLYFGWIINEMMPGKASFKTAINTGFSFLWAAAHWLYRDFYSRSQGWTIHSKTFLAINIWVTLAVMAIGLVALISGLRRRYPKHASFLGHTRFSNYFMITIFPIQSNYLPWTADRATAIVLFALPIWVLCQFGFIPLRK